MRKRFAKTRLARSIASALERLEDRTLFSTAAFVKADLTTKGTWTGVYGADGYSVVGGSASLPGYATYSVTGNSFYEWESQNSSDVRAPQTNPSSPVRVAATDFTATSETYNLNITDGKTHQVAFYVLDQDARNRGETITITDAATNAVLDTRDITNFSGGEYVVYNVSGNVNVKVTNDAGSLNAVVSGIFFDPGPGGAGSPTSSAGSATLTATDTVTKGNWTGTYGADGYSVVGGSTSLPGYATFSVTGNSFYQWAPPGSSDPRSLQVIAGDTQHVAATDFTATSETFNVNITDGKTHQVALYVLDQDNRNRSETVTVTDATTNTVLSTTDVHNFSGGDYLVYNIGGNVKITVTNDAGSLNAVASGLFFGPATSTGNPTTLTVGPGKQFGTIQAAVNAAVSGDTIDVYSGTYTEQVTIPIGLNNLTLEAAQGQIVTIKAPSSMDSTGAIVHIDGSMNTILQGFTITGPGSTAGALKYGVLVDTGGSATIQNNDVTHIEDASFGASPTTGYGIAVTDGSANVFSNIVDNYQKGGILIGLTSAITGSPTWTQVGDVEGNFVTGIGGSTLLTQNGIVFSGLGATGTAKMNHVTGNNFTQQGPEFGNAAGILLFDAGNSVTVLNNIAFSNDTNIVVDGGVGASPKGSNFAIVSGNTVYNATVFDGIDLTDGVTKVTVSQNYSHNNKTDGLFIDSNTSGNTISNNTLANNGNNGASGFDIEDQTYSASNLNKAPLYGTLNFYSGNIFGTSNDPNIPSS
jgi:hypothetical protein